MLRLVRGMSIYRKLKGIVHVNNYCTVAKIHSYTETSFSEARLTEALCTSGMIIALVRRASPLFVAHEVLFSVVCTCSCL